MRRDLLPARVRMRQVIAGLLLVSICVAPAMARKWSSRSGGFSVDAELVDVRDGNAILKKADGAEVAVPFGKLSLGDVQYIHEVLRSAEAGISGEPEPEAPPPVARPAEPAAEAKKPPDHNGPRATRQPIHYDWKKGQVYHYKLHAQVRVGDKQEDVTGNVIYTVESIGEGGATMTFVESTVRHSMDDYRGMPSYPGSPIHVPWRFRGPPLGVPPFPTQPNRIKVDGNGRILSVEGGENLPYLLGRTAHLPIEPLSPLNKNSWTITGDVAVSLSREDWLPHTGFSSVRSEQLPAHEKSTYTIQGKNGPLVNVHKAYELTSVAESEGKPRVWLGGDGVLKFDTKAGVFRSSQMNLRIAVREGGAAVELPIGVGYELLSEAELAKLKAEREQARKAFEERRKDQLKPITPDDMKQIIADMQSGDSARLHEATRRLTSKRPKEPNRELAEALEKLLKSDTPMVRESAVEALETWATRESIPTLVKLLDDESPIVRSRALKALGRLKATSAIDRIIEQWPEDRFAVTQALCAMGSAAEPAVLRQLARGNRRTRCEACRVLGEIGTKKSVRALENAKNDPDRMVQTSAEIALAKLGRQE